VALFTNLVSLLSKSSLLNIPLFPVKLISNAGAAGIGGLGNLLDDVGAAINDFIFDDKYSTAQKALRSEKKITGITGGLGEGAKRAIEGVEGLFDIFRQPIRGAQEAGVTGFIAGIGKGLIGTVVKPVAKVGEALGDISTGVSKLAASGDVSMSRPTTLRRRLPRAFYGSGYLQEYSKMDSVVQTMLGEEGLLDVEAVVEVPSQGKKRLGALLLCQNKIRYIELILDTKQVDVFWEVHSLTLKGMEVNQGKLVITDVLGKSHECLLPKNDKLGDGLADELRRSQGGSHFDWRPWLELRASMPFRL